MTSILNILLIILFSLFPIFLWGYGVSLLSAHEWNRVRFFYGILSGMLSVGIVYFFRELLLQSDSVRIYTFVGILFTISGASFVATYYGSPFIRGFLQKIVFLHFFLFLSCYFIFEGMQKVVPSGTISVAMFSSLVGIIFAATLEEGVKHISSIGLTAREFRFSRRDLLVFSFFITLGFVFCENVLYFILAFHSTPGTLLAIGISRSIFSLLAHLLSASICILFWWKALSYGVFSIRYSITFVFGCIVAIASHALFNFLIQSNNLLGVILFGVVSYIAWTKWMVSE